MNILKDKDTDKNINTDKKLYAKGIIFLFKQYYKNNDILKDKNILLFIKKNTKLQEKWKENDLKFEIEYFFTDYLLEDLWYSDIKDTSKKSVISYFKNKFKESDSLNQTTLLSFLRQWTDLYDLWKEGEFQKKVEKLFLEILDNLIKN